MRTGSKWCNRPGCGSRILTCLLGLISISRSSSSFGRNLDVAAPSRGTCTVGISFTSSSELDWSTILWSAAAAEASAAYLGGTEGFTPRAAPTISATIKWVGSMPCPLIPLMKSCEPVCLNVQGGRPHRHAPLAVQPHACCRGGSSCACSMRGNRRH